MNTRLEELKGELMGLPVADRAMLAQALLESLGRDQSEACERFDQLQRDPILGQFGDEPELLDWVVEEAMQARETQPLRMTGH